MSTHKSQIVSDQIYCGTFGNDGQTRLGKPTTEIEKIRKNGVMAMKLIIPHSDEKYNKPLLV